MTDPQVAFTLDHEAIATQSSLGSSITPWKTVTAIWKFPVVWLLLFGDHGYSTLPIAQVPADAAAFFEERVKAHGGTVS